MFNVPNEKFLKISTLCNLYHMLFSLLSSTSQNIFIIEDYLRYMHYAHTKFASNKKIHTSTIIEYHMRKLVLLSVQYNLCF